MKLRTFAATVAVGWLATTGCESEEPRLPPPTADPEPGYASMVCGQFDAWLRTINASLKDFASGSPARDTVAEERAAVLEHLDEVAAATAGLAEDVRRASLEPVTGSGAFSGRILEVLREVEATIAEVRMDVVELRRANLSRYREDVGPLLGRRMGAAIQRALGVLTAGPAGALAPHFEASPACEGIFGQGSIGLPA